MLADLNSNEDQMMTKKLTDALVSLLRSGSQRSDHCLDVPTGKAASARKSAAKLIDAGWLKEVRARSSSPVWRTDEETGVAFSLKLTAAGLKVISANDVRRAAAEAAASAPGDDEPVVVKPLHAPVSDGQGAPPKQTNFREGSKLAAVMAKLGREGGVTVDELSAAMEWLPHSTRAVLTGLRKRGVPLSRRKSADKRSSVYVIETDREAANGQA